MTQIMTLGEAISKLSLLPAGADVEFDFGGFNPTTIASWRGIYAEPALGFAHVDNCEKVTTVASLLEELQDSLENQYEGWKGGSFQFTKDSPLHVDNPGEYTQTALADIIEDDGLVVLVTRRLS